jgi:hypothetical protein
MAEFHAYSKPDALHSDFKTVTAMQSALTGTPTLLAGVVFEVMNG